MPMKRVNRRKIEIAKVPRKRRAKKIGRQDPGLEFVKDCDLCGKSLGLTRVRNAESVQLNKSMPKNVAAYALKDKDGKYLFFCSFECRSEFIDRQW